MLGETFCRSTLLKEAEALDKLASELRAKGRNAEAHIKTLRAKSLRTKSLRSEAVNGKKAY